VAPFIFAVDQRPLQSFLFHGTVFPFFFPLENRGLQGIIVPGKKKLLLFGFFPPWFGKFFLHMRIEITLALRAE